MAQPRRSTVHIGGFKFDAVCSQVKLHTSRDEVGLPMMGKLFTKLCVWVDVHDKDNIPFSTISGLFDLANIVTKEKIVDMKIEFWRDDDQLDAICTFSFKGWISTLLVCNPMHGMSEVENGVPSDLNHLLYLELEPQLNAAHYKEVTISN
jgi:hypothetical protein